MIVVQQISEVIAKTQLPGMDFARIDDFVTTITPVDGYVGVFRAYIVIVGREL